jgi:small subunit ribosomal protein S1
MENLKSPVPPAHSLAASPDPAAPSGENSFADILSEFEQKHHGPARGQATQGTVVSVTPDAIFVDIGRKIDGILPTQLFRDDAGTLSIHVGDKVLVTITGSDGEGSYTLSTIKVERPKDWSALEKAFAENRAISGRVTEVVKGGLRVDVGVPAFLPGSRSGAKEQADLEKLVGQDIQCKIIKLDTADEDVVVDRRTVLEEEEKQSRQKRLAELVEGVTLRGTVRSVTDFGAFVDLGGGLDGLLHVTDMAWHRVAKPSDFVNPGDSVEVKILKISPETRRISLGMKQLTPDPWTVASENFQVGQRVHGKVSRLQDFGAFIELAPGVDGLIHVSEMSWAKKIKRPADVLKVGESVEVVVLGVNAAERRIALGLKQALGDPWEEASRKYAPGTIVEGPVSSLTNFGCFVSLGDGVEGMIHISDITREKRLNHPREALTAGQKVRAVVLELDQERRRIKLGIKQLEPTTADEYIGEHQAGETVTGRIVEARRGQAKVELGEGVFAECRLPEPAAEAPAAAPQPDRVADLSSLTAMLSAKWKQGASAVKSEGPEPVRAGQIRTFKILKLDQAGKKIEVELAS